MSIPYGLQPGIVGLDRRCGLLERDGVSAAGDGAPRQPAEMYVYRPPSAGDRLRPDDPGDKLSKYRLLGHCALRHVSKPAAKAIGMAHILLARGDDLGPEALMCL